MKKVFRRSVFVGVFFVVSGAVFGQAAVSVVNDSTGTTFMRSKQIVQWGKEDALAADERITRWESVVQAINTASNTVALLQTANQTLQYQFMVFEKLGEGEWDSFIEALQLQASAVGSFANTMESYNQVAGDFDWEQKTPVDIHHVRDMEMMIGNTAEILRDSTDLYRNMQARAEAMGKLMQQSSNSGSMLESLQLQSQMLGLVGQSLDEAAALAINRQQAIAATMEMERVEEQLRVQQLADAYEMSEDEIRMMLDGLDDEFYIDDMNHAERFAFLIGNDASPSEELRSHEARVALYEWYGRVGRVDPNEGRIRAHELSAKQEWAEEDGLQ